MPTTVYYNPRGDDTGHRHRLTLIADYDLTDDSWNDTIAEECAKDWHANKDGWEGSWPRVFSVYRQPTGPAFARFEVALEYEPTFSATTPEAT